MIDKLILAALLTEWKDRLDVAIDGLEEYPILKDGRKEVDIENSDELRELWSVCGSIGNLISALESRKETNSER